MTENTDDFPLLETYVGRSRYRGGSCNFGTQIA